MRKTSSLAYPYPYLANKIVNHMDLDDQEAISQDLSCFFQLESNSNDQQSEFFSTSNFQISSKLSPCAYSTDFNNDGMETGEQQEVQLTDLSQQIQQDLIYEQQSKDTSTKLFTQESCQYTTTQKAKKWTQREDKLLLKYHEMYNGKWEEISKLIKGRNASQCFQRWRRMFPEQRVNVSFNDKMDAQILRLVNQLGQKWTKIAQSKYRNNKLVIQEFSPKQIRDRFVNVLDRKINKNQFSNEEDQQIIALYLEFGPKWKKIADILENRTDNDVKNRFYGNLRKRYLGIQNRYQTIHKSK